ncbi:hypothetical protein F5Y14DRAFT_448923 [Nemania sp. NC0429]|nr:hypothetical protein F5Y14DRAFT_448923 [Nemania sp. NC0429]
MSLTLYHRQRREHVLGRGQFSGYVRLDSGWQVWLEYEDELVRQLSFLDDVRGALEYTAAMWSEQTVYNYVLIRSMFHQSKFRGIIRAIDRQGLHIDVTAAVYDNGVEVESRRAKIYIFGFDEGKPDGHWYDYIGVSHII